MKHIKLYKDKDAFNADSENLVSPYLCMIESDYSFSVSKQSQPEIPEEPEEPEVVGNYIVATYNVTNPGNTRILGVSGNLPNLFDKMIINGVEMTPAQTYTFNTTGEVEVKWILKDGYKSFAQLFEECYPLMKLDFSNCDMSNVVDMSSMLQYCENVVRMDFSGPINANVSCYEMFGSSMNGTLIIDKEYEANYARVIEDADRNDWDLQYSDGTSPEPDIPEEPEEPEVLDNYIVATYNVDSIEEDVKIVTKMNLVKNVTLNINGEWEEKNLLDGGNFEFNEEGAHTMRIYLNEDYSDLSNLFESCDKLTTLDFSNVDMTKVTTLAGLILDACNLQSLTITGPINNTVKTDGVLFDTCAAGVAKFYYDKNYTNDYQSLINEAKQFWGETNVIGI